MNKDYTPFEAHHFYWGVILLVIAFILTFIEAIPIWIIYSLDVIAFALIIDDIYQHIRQRKDRAYHSPIHILYGKYLWKIPWIQKLNKWVDKLFGG